MAFCIPNRMQTKLSANDYLVVNVVQPFADGRATLDARKNQVIILYWSQNTLVALQ